MNTPGVLFYESRQNVKPQNGVCGAATMLFLMFCQLCYIKLPPPPSLSFHPPSLVAVPVGVAVVSIFGLVFTVSGFAWICCQRKDTKSQKTPPYKFVHMLKGVDIYPESLSGKKKFAAPPSTAANDAGKTDVNGNCHTASLMIPPANGKLASSPNESRQALHLDLEKRDLNGNFTTKPFHHHHQKLRSSPDLELPSPHAGFTQPGVVDRRDLPSPSSTLSSLAPTPAVEKHQGEEKVGGLGILHFSLEYQADKKAFIVHIKVGHLFHLPVLCFVS